MFGGAFARGTRDREDYIPYFEYLVSKGYNVVSIDYRLGLKDIDLVENLTDEAAAGMLVNSIQMAVDDLLDATSYVIAKAQEWGIDTRRIVLNGSSAGAVTVLQAEYELSNGGHPGRLPDNFRFAGTIAFAGAVLTLDGGFSYGKEPAPMLLMHGDADRQVPYGVLSLDEIGFYGSKYISEVLTRSGVPHYFYSFADYGHEVASLPIREYWQEVDSFLLHLVERREPITINAFVGSGDKPAVEGKNFTISDYLNGNFGL
ncbi:MAG: alpha/beta hydrolase fold domain-containing protein [Rikenellaceae bacterium]|nr:alpha/beta hydrolase fold domain-containing protein [Rikenellaceae bacterium]